MPHACTLLVCCLASTPHQVQRLESSEAAAQAAAEAARQQLREANQARLAAAAAAAETGSSSAVLAQRVAQLESQVQTCRDEALDLSRQVDALQVSEWAAWRGQGFRGWRERSKGVTAHLSELCSGNST